MSVKGGAILHVGNGLTVIDRIQNAGPNQVNIPTDKIYELGNYKSVGTIRDTPDLTFSYESLDVSTECEALLTGQYGGRDLPDAAVTAGGTTLTSATAGFTAEDTGRMVIIAGAGTGGAEWVTTIAAVTDATTVELADATPTAAVDAGARITTNGFDLSRSTAVDMASQWKPGKNAADPFKILASVATPFLFCNQMTYRFGMTDNATQAGQLTGDTIFYNPGPTYTETTPGGGAAGQIVTTAHPAFQSAEGDDRRVLAVTVGADKRLTKDTDYTETYGAVTNGAAITTVTLNDPVDVTESIRIIYSSPDPVEYPQSVHPSATVKPAAVRGRDIEVYLGGYDPNDRAGSKANFLTGIQSAEVNWQVNITKAQEFGNYYAVGQDEEIPETNGSVDFLPRDSVDLLARLRKITGVTDENLAIGTTNSTPLALDVVVKNPDTKQVVKRLHVNDARFTVPGFQGQVNQTTTLTLNYESDDGALLVFER